MMKKIAIALAALFMVSGANAELSKYSTVKEPHVYSCESFMWKDDDNELPIPGVVSVAADLSSFTIHNSVSGEKMNSGKKNLEMIGDIRRYSSGAEVSLRNGRSYMKFRETKGSFFKIGVAGDPVEKKAGAYRCVRVV